MAEVVHLFVALVHRFPAKEIAEIYAIKDKGFDECIHGRPGSKRQVLVMDVETLEKFGLSAGSVKENITTRGLDMRGLSPGRRICIGDAVFEVTAPCEPCSRMDEIREGLRDELRGQRGWLCRVAQGGVVRRGDRIEVLPMPAAASAATKGKLWRK